MRIFQLVFSPPLALASNPNLLELRLMGCRTITRSVRAVVPDLRGVAKLLIDKYIYVLISKLSRILQCTSQGHWQDYI